MRTFAICLVQAILLAAVIICVAHGADYFFLKNSRRLEFALFALGAIPIILFLPGLFSGSGSGALHTPKVIFRKVDTLESRGSGPGERILPSLSYVAAGLLVWLYSWVIV